MDPYRDAPTVALLEGSAEAPIVVHEGSLSTLRRPIVRERLCLTLLAPVLATLATLLGLSLIRLAWL